MSDLDRSFDHLSLGAAHQRSSTGSLGPNSAGAFDAGDAANAYGAAPLSSASPFGSASYAGMGGSAQLADPQSASARFERFFASPPASAPDYASGSGGAPGSSNGLGSGSSAFGSFGHALPGGTGGSGHFGSQSRRPPGRSALPQWGDAPSPPIAPQGLGRGYYAPPPPQQSHPSAGSGFLSHQLPPQGMPLPPPGQQGGALDDDIIPTAIVVKNIPFSIKKEQLLQIIVSPAARRAPRVRR
jgi:hypothetical protein